MPFARRLPDRLRIALDMRPLTASPARTALPAAHFDRNERYDYFGDRTLGGFAFQGFLECDATDLDLGKRSVLCNPHLLHPDEFEQRKKRNDNLRTACS
jgi:hypothetical protein